MERTGRKFMVHVEGRGLDVTTGRSLADADEHVRSVAPDASAACLLDHEHGILSATLQVR